MWIAYLFSGFILTAVPNSLNASMPIFCRKAPARLNRETTMWVKRNWRSISKRTASVAHLALQIAW
jgi:anti-sigma-K factor RskA